MDALDRVLRAAAYLLAAALAVSLVVGALVAPPEGTPPLPPEPVSTAVPFAAGADTRRISPPALVQQSIDDPNSYWVVVNKQRPLSIIDFEASDMTENVPVPAQRAPYLRAAVADAVVQMFAAITAETGLQLQLQSTFRSYAAQQYVYNNWVGSIGQAGADLTSARPGHSEHQTGLAVDVNALPDVGCSLQPCWGNTPQAAWIGANAWRFGFIVRYPADKTPITGYEYEPYHLRYVGVDLATVMHDEGITTLEEYFELPPAPTY